MKATAANFLKFMQGTKQFIIPIYQRTYSWQIEDCRQLWSDIESVAKNDYLSGHFIGSIVYIEKDIYHISSVTQLLVIDGQQRLTTIMLLLMALSEVLQEQGKELNAEITPRKIRNQYLFNPDEDGDAHYKLLLTRSDKDTLIHLLDGEPEPDHSSIRLKENYHFFKEQLRREDVDPLVFYRGICKLMMVDISLEQGKDNPQLIFESLNSTGVDLSQADLIRNYVLMGLDPAEQTMLYKNYWYPIEQRFLHSVEGIKLFDRFMRDYLTIKQGKIPNIMAVYSHFKGYHREEMAAKVPISEIVKDIFRYACYFINMALLQEKDQNVKNALADINTVKVDVAYPFLLEVYADYEQQRLNKQDFIAILKLIESYVFRRAICGIPTNALNKVFVTLAKEIDKDHYLESVKAAFLQKTSGARFPSDEEFSAAFVVKDIYHFRLRNYVLGKLENYNSKEWVPVDAYTIEHIMPQNENLSEAWQHELGSNWQEIHERYLHTIGNLTLTGYNAQLSDRPFREKRDMPDGFADSPIRLNQSLKALERWNKEEIEKRGAELAKRAVELWAMPHLSIQFAGKMKQLEQGTALAVVIGPQEHPEVGFVPEDVKVVQVAETRFHLFRKIDDEWVQYGDGKSPWFAKSWKTVGSLMRSLLKTQKIPLGVGGEKRIVTYAAYLKEDMEVLTDYTWEHGANGGKDYTLADHPYLQGDVLTIFEHLRKRILNLDDTVREEIKKHYIAYKAATNFVDIEPQKKRLKLTLNMPFLEIDDPLGLCRDVSGVGHYGNGDIEVGVASLAQLDDVISLIRQSFERHQEDDDE